MKFVSLSATLLSVLISFLNLSNAFASTVEAELRLPWEEINREIPLQKSQFEWGETQLLFQDLPFVFKNMRLDLQSQAQEIMHFNTKPFQSQLKLSGLQLNLTTGTFSIRKDIFREISGVQVIVKLSADCAPVQLQQQDIQVMSQFEWDFDEHNVASRIKTFDVVWPTSGWKISEIRCQGPLGFADIIQNELQKQFTHPEVMFPFVQEQLQNHLNAKISQLSKSILGLNLKFLQNRLQSEVQKIKSIDFRGVSLGLKIALQDQDSQHYALQKNLDSIFTKANLVVSIKGLEKILQVSSEGQSFQSTEEQMSGFKQLMRSRFLQFFLWPDLMNFPKHSKFNFIHKLNNESKIELLAGGKMKLAVKGDSWLQAERDGKMWNYVFFRTQFNTQSRLAIEDSKIKISFDNNSLKLSKQFGNDYKSRFHPSERISTSIVQTALKETYLKSTLSWELPTLEIRSGLQFKVRSMNADRDSNYVFEFQRP